MKIGTVRFILSIVSLALAAGALWALTTQTVAEANREALFLALGIILGLSKDSFGFYFGSSQHPEPNGQVQPVKVENAPDEPVPTTDLPTPQFGRDV